jgi:hypothetical protein
MALPFRERIKLLWQWSYWRANFRWPVIWRRVVVFYVIGLSLHLGYYTVRGFQTVALERQELGQAAYVLEQAAQQAQTTKAGSAQDLQARQNAKKSLGLLAASANKPLPQFLAEVTGMEANPFAQFVDADVGVGEFCKRLRLSVCEHTDAATHRARLNVGTLYCQVSVPCWDDLSPVEVVSFADAMGRTASERAQGIAKYCRGREPEKLTDADISFSTSEELRILQRFKCWK